MKNEIIESEAERISIMLKSAVPELAERMQELADFQRMWASVVGPAVARHSVPYDFMDNTIYIAARTPHVVQIINNMKGNIRREFALRFAKNSLAPDIRVTQGPPPSYSHGQEEQNKQNRQKMKIDVSNEELEAIIKTLPAELISSSPDAARALAHLKAFFNKRFC